jgi:hypothetical protein
MFEIQYVKDGVAQRIPIMYEDLDLAKTDAQIFKPGLEKRIVNIRTQEVMWRAPSLDSYASFINFKSS